MDNYFANLGFDIQSPHDLITILKEVADCSEFIECLTGYYIKWQDEDGAQLWFYFNDEDALCGVSIGFGGQGVLPVAVIGYTDEEHNSVNIAGLHCWAAAEDDSLNYPFVFDMVNKCMMTEQALQYAKHAQLTAFADSIKSYANEQEYENDDEYGVSFAVECFIPSGLCSAEDGDTEQRQSSTILGGRILDTKTCINEVTQQQYEWALVKTLGGTVDIVCSPDSLDKPLVKGGIVSGSFWLVGELLTTH